MAKLGWLFLSFLLATPVAGWLPVGHPLHGSGADGCTVGLPWIGIVAVASASWTVAWDLDGDGVYERSEFHTHENDRWNRFGPPVLFDADVERVLSWKVTYAEPLADNGTAWLFPIGAYCPTETLPGGLVDYRCWDVRLAGSARGRAVYNRNLWEVLNSHPAYNPEKRDCPELARMNEPPVAELFADGFESGDVDRWSGSRGFGLLIFADGFETGTTERWK